MEIVGLRTGSERQREERRIQRWEPGTAADSERSGGQARQFHLWTLSQMK